MQARPISRVGWSDYYPMQSLGAYRYTMEGGTLGVQVVDQGVSPARGVWSLRADGDAGLRPDAIHLFDVHGAIGS